MTTHTQPALIPSTINRAASSIATAALLEDHNKNPLNILYHLANTRASVENALEEYVRASRVAGATWAEIAGAIGVTRQSAHAMYAARMP